MMNEMEIIEKTINEIMDANGKREKVLYGKLYDYYPEILGCYEEDGQFFIYQTDERGLKSTYGPYSTYRETILHLVLILRLHSEEFNRHTDEFRDLPLKKNR